MSSPKKEAEEPTSSSEVVNNGKADAAGSPRPPAKRRLSNTVIEISDTESDDSDICAVTSYQASADEVKRIRGEEYSSNSSTSSSSDYSSDSESPWEDDSILLEDEKPQSKLLRAQLNPRANRMDDPKLNPALQSQDLIDRLTAHWKEKKDLSNEEITFTNDPFRLCVLHELLANEDMINNIVDDMNTLDWSRKKMDLYEFHQTADLASLTWQRSIKGIYELLKTDVMNWVSKITGLQLKSVSASCSLYGPGDHLLTHDDLMGDRRVAFILYLAPWRPGPATVTENGDGDSHIEEVDVEARGWSASLGGALKLRSCVQMEGAKAAAPGPVVRSLTPANNMLAFFAVGKETYHEVDEVLSLELPRLSINGWFHGPAPDLPDHPINPEEHKKLGQDEEESEEADEENEPPTDAKPIHNHIVVLQEWVSAAYMSARARAQLQTHMERDSELSLHAFLAHDRLTDLMEALGGTDIPWEECGPSNSRRYHRIPPHWAEDTTDPPTDPATPTTENRDPPHLVKELLKLVSSNSFKRLLADCTDLNVTKYERLELQRWTAGDYTLLPPRELYQAPRLEAVLFLGAPNRPLSGGGVTYVAPEDTGGAGLVSAPPKHNALSLVYCDAGAASFTKYLSKLTMKQNEHFYILTCTYKE